MNKNAYFPILDTCDMTPLTLDQYNELSGLPVIVEKNTGKKWWAIAQSISGDTCGYGRFWWAYAYQPAHIDREAWTAEWEEDGKCDHKPYRVRDAEKWKKYKCSKCGYKAGRRASQKFCPSCGRTMTPEAWAMLEKRLMG